MVSCFFLSIQDRHSDSNGAQTLGLKVKANFMRLQHKYPVMNEIRWHRQWKRNGKTTIISITLELEAFIFPSFVFDGSVDLFICDPAIYLSARFLCARTDFILHFFLP